jgi:hypothetical protein
MQPLIEEIIEMARAKEKETREQSLMLIDNIANLQYASDSYAYRLKYYKHIPEKYLAVYLFDDEWSKIALFLSRLFIDDYSEATNNVIYHLKSLGADALEPLLDIMIEVPQRLDRDPMKSNLNETLYELLVCVYKSRNKPTWKPSKRELKKLLKAKSPIPFFKRWAKSDDPETVKAGISWLERFKDNYGIIK